MSLDVIRDRLKHGSDTELRCLLLLEDGLKDHDWAPVQECLSLLRDNRKKTQIHKKSHSHKK